MNSSMTTSNPSLSYGNRDSPMSTESRNNYFLTLTDPLGCSGVKVPDFNVAPTTTKKILISHSLEVSKPESDQSYPIGVLFTPHNPHHAGSLWVWNVQESLWTFWMYLPMTEKLTDNYARARTVSGALALVQNAIATGSAPFQGTIDAISYQDFFNLQTLHPDEVLPMNQDDKSMLANGMLASGVIMLAQPFPAERLYNIEGETVISSDIVVESYSTTAGASVDRVHFALNELMFGAYSATIIIRNAGGLPLPAQIEPSIITSREKWVPSSHTSGPSEDLPIRLSELNTGLAPGYFIRSSILNNAKIDRDPIDTFVVSFNPPLQVGVVLDIELQVSRLEDHSSNIVRNGTFAVIKNAPPGSVISMSGAINYEVVPNSNLIKDLKVTTGDNMIAYDDMSLVKNFFAKNGDPRVKFIYPLKDWKFLRDQNFFRSISTHQHLRKLQASGFSDFLGVAGKMMSHVPVLKEFAPLVSGASDLLEGLEHVSTGGRSGSQYRRRGVHLASGQLITGSFTVTWEDGQAIPASVPKQVLDKICQVRWDKQLDTKRDNFLFGGHAVTNINRATLPAIIDDKVALVPVVVARESVETNALWTKVNVSPSDLQQTESFYINSNNLHGKGIREAQNLEKDQADFLISIAAGLRAAGWPFDDAFIHFNCGKIVSTSAGAAIFAAAKGLPFGAVITGTLDWNGNLVASKDLKQKLQGVDTLELPLIIAGEISDQEAEELGVITGGEFLAGGWASNADNHQSYNSVTGRFSPGALAHLNAANASTFFLETFSAALVCRNRWGDIDKEERGDIAKEYTSSLTKYKSGTGGRKSKTTDMATWMNNRLKNSAGTSKTRKQWLDTFSEAQRNQWNAIRKPNERDTFMSRVLAEQLRGGQTKKNIRTKLNNAYSDSSRSDIAAIDKFLRGHPEALRSLKQQAPSVGNSFSPENVAAFDTAASDYAAHSGSTIPPDKMDYYVQIADWASALKDAAPKYAGYKRKATTKASTAPTFGGFSRDLARVPAVKVVAPPKAAPAGRLPSAPPERRSQAREFEEEEEEEYEEEEEEESGELEFSPEDLVNFEIAD